MHFAVPLLGLLLAALRATPAGAFGAEFLYATAASETRIDGFRLGARGELPEDPAVQATTAQDPRRILAVGCALYVAEDDRVEAFRIKPGGGLGRIGRTVIDPDMKPSHLAASPDRRILYVPEKRNNRVVAYPLGADGAPAATVCSCKNTADCGGSGICASGRCLGGAPCSPGSNDTCAAGEVCVLDFTSCALGAPSLGYQALAAHADLLYVAGSGGQTQIDVFQVDAAGNLPIPSASCDPSEGTRTLTRQVWCRRRINGPRLAVDENGTLYIGDRFRGQILAFKQLVDPPLVDADDTSLPCTESTATCVCSSKKKLQPAPDVKTAVVAPYEEITLDQSTLYATDFEDGRVDAYRLQPNAAKPIAKHPKESEEDVRMSPVGLTVVDNVLYVAAGEDDRVRAYRIGRNSDGAVTGLELVGETNEQEGSFPNDVAAAVPSSCPAGE